jgi:hypothetical protein
MNPDPVYYGTIAGGLIAIALFVIVMILGYRDHQKREREQAEFSERYEREQAERFEREQREQDERERQEREKEEQFDRELHDSRERYDAHMREADRIVEDARDHNAYMSGVYAYLRGERDDLPAMPGLDDLDDE